MSVFLERQKVRRQKVMIHWAHLLEKGLLCIVVVFGGVAALYGLYLLVFMGPSFAISKVVVDGKLIHIDPQEIQDMADVGQGQNIFSVDVSLVHERVKSHPWVRQAAVRRRLPHTLVIYVWEYEPMVIVEMEGALNLADHDGVVFKKLGPEDPKLFPVITGVPAQEEKSVLKDCLAVLALWRSSSVGRSLGLSEIHYDSAKGFYLITEMGPVEIYLGRDISIPSLDMLTKIQPILEREGKGYQPKPARYILADDQKKLTVGYNEM